MACCMVSRWKLSYIFCAWFMFCTVIILNLQNLPWYCWLGMKKSIWSIKSWVVRYWHGYLSVQMSGIWSSWCHCHLIISCFTEIQNRLTFPGAGLPTLFWKNMPLHGLDLQNCPLCFTMVGYLSTCWALVPCWHQCLSSLQCFDTASQQTRNQGLNSQTLS